MKNKIMLLLSLIAILFSACDYNEKYFAGYDDNSDPVNKVSYEYTIVTDDFSTIASALRANNNYADSLLATLVSNNKVFSTEVSAAQIVPYLLKSKYFTADLGSSVLVTYNFDHGRNEVVTNLSTDSYVVSNDDYKLIWGDPYATAFTPEKSPETSIPIILNQRYGSPEDGQFVNMEYYYSEEEPIISIVENKYIDEPFEGYDSGSGVKLEIDGWLNINTTNGTKYWECRAYSGNQYTQISANSTSAVNDSWLITKKIDLSGAANPKFSFDIKIGYFTADCLIILLSEDFDGNESSINTATWTDITSNFTIPQEPTNGYGDDFVTAGEMDMTSYAGKSFYIAFHYDGDDTSDPKRTTTYQLDNVKISEKITGIAVEEKSLQYAAYNYSNSTWALAADVVSLQPDDYDEMGVSYLSESTSGDYLPTYLSGNYPYGQEGEEKTIVYKTSKTANRGDEYIFTNGIWALNSFIEQITDQFVRTSDEWIYDPSVVVYLNPIKNESIGVAYYQAMTDWVWENIDQNLPDIGKKGDGYVTSYGNNEYYTGASAHYNNVDWRPSAARAQYAAGYEGKTDDEVSALLKEHFVHVLGEVLPILNPNAKYIEGIDIIYTIYVGIYTGITVSSVNHQIVYKLIGDAQFEYVEDSFQPI